MKMVGAMGESFAGVPTFNSAEMSDDRLKLLIHGTQGSGKTYLASSIAELGPTLFLDVIGERGTKSFQGTPWAKNITVMRPTSITALDDVYWQLAKGGHGFKAVVLDSMSAAQRTAMRFLTGHEETAVREIRKGSQGADRQSWGRLAEILGDIAVFWYGLADGERDEPMHVVLTAQTKVMDDSEGATRAYPDVSPASRNLLLAAAGYVVYADREQVFPDDGGEPVEKHVVRLGYTPGAYTKGRIPPEMQAKIPAVLGRNAPLTLAKFCKALKIPQ
jgi:hypothetical protein